MNGSRYFPAALTIAGSDSGGGAGVQADLRTFNAFKVYGCSVITAVTGQNPFEVRRVDILPAEAVRIQLETVLDAIPVRFAKTGMLGNSEVVKSVAEVVSERKLPLVIDPVMVSTSGAKLLDEAAVSTMKNRLFPLAEWLTPNIPEAELLCSDKITSSEDVADAAMMLHRQYHCNIILKSGHLVNAECAADTVCYNGKLFTLTSPRLGVAGNFSHGTGCTLSAAFAANLALGKSVERALVESKAFVYGSLVEKIQLSEELFQMYVPEKSYSGEISLKR